MKCFLTKQDIHVREAVISITKDIGSVSVISSYVKQNPDSVRIQFAFVLQCNFNRQTVFQCISTLFSFETVKIML